MKPTRWARQRRANCVRHNTGDIFRMGDSVRQLRQRSRNYHLVDRSLQGVGERITLRDGRGDAENWTTVFGRCY